MNNKPIVLSTAIIAIGLTLGYFVMRMEKAAPAGGHGHHEEGGHGHEEHSGGHEGGHAHEEEHGHGDGEEHEKELGHGHDEEHEKDGGHGHEPAHGDEVGRVEISPESVRASGIEVDTAGPAVMESTLSLNGKIMPNEDRLAHIFARFPGVVKEVRKHLGEQVRKGEVLAIVESNESLEAYSVVTRIDGTIIRKHVTAGETVGADEELFAITDLNSVWADFSVYRHDFPRLRKGQKVSVDAGEGSQPAVSALAYLSPIGAEHTQTMTARAAIPNRSGEWPPGLFVKGTVVLTEFLVPVAVKAQALQTLGDRDVVFVNTGNAFAARPVGLGRRDGEWVEVVSGLERGEKYVTRNSYVIKADIGKAGAGHDH